MIEVVCSADITAAARRIHRPSSPRFVRVVPRYAEKLDGVEIRDCEVSARRDERTGHSLWDLSAFNTDGFDLSGRNVWYVVRTCGGSSE